MSPASAPTEISSPGARPDQRHRQPNNVLAPRSPFPKVDVQRRLGYPDAVRWGFWTFRDHGRRR